MANDLNECNFIGHLGKDPEIRATKDGESVTTFSMAVGWKTTKNEGTEWVNVVTFGKLADACGKFLRKGSQIFIRGRLTTKKYMSKEGIEKTFTNIVADKMQMVGGKPEQRNDNNDYHYAEPNGNRASKLMDMDDDIPF